MFFVAAASRRAQGCACGWRRSASSSGEDVVDLVAARAARGSAGGDTEL